MKGVKIIVEEELRNSETSLLSDIQFMVEKPSMVEKGYIQRVLELKHFRTDTPSRQKHLLKK